MENELLLKTKEDFIKNGYCSFPLEIIDSEFTELLSEYLICSDDKNIQELFTEFRYDSATSETKCAASPHSNYANLEKIKQLLYDLEPNKELISQIWYSNKRWSDISESLKNDNLRKIIENGLNKILSYLYDLSEYDDLEHRELQLTYYNKNCRFHPHTDGAYTGKLCSILIYLNKDYNKDDGGLLILNDSLITPEFGTVAVMDLENHDIFHGVTEVVDGPGRYAILSFPEVKRNKIL